jgi:DHA2 family multidrug resistance protein
MIFMKLERENGAQLHLSGVKGKRTFAMNMLDDLFLTDGTKLFKAAASGLMNFMRNIGQSIGTSAVTTLIARRSQFHQSILAEHTASGRFKGAITGLASQLNHAGLSLQAAYEQAIGRLYGMVQMQAAALSYSDVYWLLALSAAAMFFASFLLKKNEPGKSGHVAIH